LNLFIFINLINTMALRHNALKLAYISDIHLEFWARGVVPRIKPYTKANTQLNGIALLGDIGNPFHSNYAHFLRNCSDKFEKVYLLAGNHEYFHDYRKFANLRPYVTDQISEVVHSTNHETGNKNIVFLDNDRYQVNDEHIILGTTLWSNHEIYSSGDDTHFLVRRFNEFINEQYFNCVGWLEDELNKIQEENIVRRGNNIPEYKVTILSHYLPSSQLVAQKYLDRDKKKGEATQDRYFSNLEYLMEDPVINWYCGHSHCVLRRKIKNVSCGINTVGYFGKEFNGSDLQLDIIDLE
jgi:hypothetical protein